MVWNPGSDVEQHGQDGKVHLVVVRSQFLLDIDDEPPRHTGEQTGLLPCQSGGRVRCNSTHEYQGRVEVVVVLLVEVSVVLVRLSVEHLVEVSTGIHLWPGFVRWREFFNGDTQSLYRIVQAK